MNEKPAFDHVAFNVPDFAAQLRRLSDDFGMSVDLRGERFAVVTDPTTGVKFEIGQSSGPQIEFRHLGFRTEDVEGTHDALLAAGMETSRAPHRQDYARMFTSFLSQSGAIEVQLVKYDEA